MSNEATLDVDTEENRLIHSMTDLERHKKAQLFSHVKNYKDEQPSLPESSDQGYNNNMRFAKDESDTTYKSELNREGEAQGRGMTSNDFISNVRQVKGGTTGGVISSEEEDDDEYLEDDDDLNFEDRRLL